MSAVSFYSSFASHSSSSSTSSSSSPSSPSLLNPTTSISPPSSPPPPPPPSVSSSLMFLTNQQPTKSYYSTSTIFENHDQYNNNSNTKKSNTLTTTSSSNNANAHSSSSSSSSFSRPVWDWSNCSNLFISNHFRTHQLQVSDSRTALFGAGQSSAAASSSVATTNNANKKDPQEFCMLLQLPMDILNLLLLMLDAKSLANLALTCRTFRDLALDDSYWKHLFAKERHTWPHYGAPVPNRAFTSKRQLYTCYAPRSALHAMNTRLSSRALFKSVKRSLLGEAIRISVFGPGLDNENYPSIMTSLLWHRLSPFRPTKMYPGVSGVGSGIGVDMNSISLNLMTLYRATQSTRRTTPFRETNQFFDGVGRLSREISQLCKSVDIFAFVVDAMEMVELTPEERETYPERALTRDIYVEDAGAELMQLLCDHNVHKEAPLVVWAITSSTSLVEGAGAHQNNTNPNNTNSNNTNSNNTNSNNTNQNSTATSPPLSPTLTHASIAAGGNNNLDRLVLPAPVVGTATTTTTTTNTTTTTTSTSTTGPAFIPFRDAKGNVKIASAASVADSLGLHSLARPWRVFTIDVNNFRGLRDAVMWAVSYVS